MSARDKLAELVEGASYAWKVRLPLDADDIPPEADDIADAILAAGWRPPARTIETEEELDALPDEAVIRDANGEMSMRTNVPNKFDPGHRIKWWGDRLGYGENTPVLPVTVVYTPEES